AVATDPDIPANPLTFSLVGAPAGAAINATTGVFTWTPAEDQGPGVYPFTVRVSDGTVNVDAPITITVNDVNVAPTLSGVPSTVTIDEMVAYTFTATATDPDIPAQTLTFSLVGAPTGAAITPESGAFRWTRSEAQGPGSYPFSVRVSDGVANTDAAITISVNEVNIAPTLTGVPAAATIDEQVPYTFTATATDPDLPANILTFSLVGAPARAAINATTGVFTWTPTEEQGPGTYPFSVRVSDGTVNVDAPILITVNDVNIAPTLSGVPSAVTIDEMVAYTFTATATDPDIPVQ